MLPLGLDQPAHGAPVGTLTIMTGCTVLFLWQLGLGDAGGAVLMDYGFVPARFLPDPRIPWEHSPGPRLASLLTHLFLHAGWLHLLSNLVFIWVFSRHVEEAMGHAGFIMFYLLCGVTAALGHYWLSRGSGQPMIGASGAVSGTLGACLVFFPRANVQILVPVFVVLRTVSVPVWVVLASWCVIQLLYTAVPDHVLPPIAVGAHLAGFAAGCCMALLFRK